MLTWRGGPTGSGNGTGRATTCSSTSTTTATRTRSATRGPCGRLPAEEADQRLVELPGVADVAAVRGTFQHDQLGLRQGPMGQQARPLEGHRLVAVSVQDQRGHGDLG